MKFYHLSDGEKYPLAEWADEMDFEETIYCTKHEGHQRAGKRKEQLIIKLPSSKIADFIWTWYHECIITDRVAKLFKDAGFRGYNLKPVIVSKVSKYHTEKDIALINGKAVGIKKVTRDRNPKPIPLLWELVIVGKGGEAHQKSGIKLKYECRYCGMKRYSSFSKGLFIDKTKGDGSDFFTLWPLPKFIIVTERVKRFIEELKLTNCKLEATELLIGKGEKGTLSPC